MEVREIPEEVRISGTVRERYPESSKKRTGDSK